MIDDIDLVPESKCKHEHLMVAQMIRNPPAMQGTQVQSLGQEDSLEREWLTTPVFLLGEFHGQRSLAGSSPAGKGFLL